MAGKRRIVVSDIGEVSVVRFIDRKIVDSANIEEMGEELFSVVEKDKRRFVLLNFDGVEFLVECCFE
jgi:anti-sigma B factor antagonist